jgi:hypothetical protein
MLGDVARRAGLAARELEEALDELLHGARVLASRVEVGGAPDVNSARSVTLSLVRSSWARSDTNAWDTAYARASPLSSSAKTLS